MLLSEFKNLESVKSGKTFTITFIKKNGEVRVMNARLGVKKHLKGGTLKYDPSKYNLLGCYDMQSGGYRMINFDTITEIKVGGEVFAY